MQRRADRIFAEIDVRAGADGDVELRVIRIEQQRAGPVTLAGVAEGDDFFALAGGHGLGVVFVALDRGRLGDIEPAFMKGQAERPIEIFDDLLACAFVDDIDDSVGLVSGPRIRQDQLIAGAEEHKARPLETAGCVLFHLEAGRNLKGCAVRLLDDPRAIASRGRMERFGQSRPIHRLLLGAARRAKREQAAREQRCASSVCHAQ